MLGGRTLRISREEECDLLTSEGSARAAELLRDNCPTAGSLVFVDLEGQSWHRQDASEAVQRTTAGSRGIEVGEATAGYKLLVCVGVSSWLPRFR